MNNNYPPKPPINNNSNNRPLMPMMAGVPYLPPNSNNMFSTSGSNIKNTTNIIVPVPHTKKPFCKVPNNTVYVSNLNEKIKLPRLKQALRDTFERFGVIMDVIAQSSLKMHGQAFIVFELTESAVKAVKELNNQPLFNRAMAVQFSQNKSDYTAQKEGQSIEQRKRSRHENRGAPKLADQLLMNKTLFVQNIPAGITQFDLEHIFMQYAGFKEVRLVPGKKNLAFVEFESDVQAALAKDALFNYRITEDDVLVISFAKR